MNTHVAGILCAEQVAGEDLRGAGVPKDVHEGPVVAMHVAVTSKQRQRVRKYQLRAVVRVQLPSFHAHAHLQQATEHG